MLEFLPSLDLTQPRLDKPLLEHLIEEHLRQLGAPRRPFRWFADARSAREYAPGIELAAEPAFPLSSGAPSAFSAAWLAGSQPRPCDRLFHEDAAVPPIDSLPALVEMFAAGLFYYWIGSREVVCVPRPSLWLEHGRLHRADGPAVEWPSGERYFFWHGIEVPSWIIEIPQAITREHIAGERNPSLRHCMMERFGMERFTILERWQEWRTCHYPKEFTPFVASSLHHTFRAVSDRITAHAQDTVQALMPGGVARPRDKGAAVAAMLRFLAEWGEAARPICWFVDCTSALAYIRARGGRLPRAAYWPRLRLARALDAVWLKGLRGFRTHGNAEWIAPREDWQDWSIETPRALDCDLPDALSKRCERYENWVTALHMTHEGTRDVSAIDIRSLSSFEPAITRWTPLMEAFAAGVFYYWISANEIVCIVRPLLWIFDGRLHREDGPAVEWPDGRKGWYWRGVEVPHWIITEPQGITLQTISSTRNLELRRCMIERFGQERFLRETAAELIGEDQYGKLWHPKPDEREASHRIVQVENGTGEQDGTRRNFFLRVPPQMQSAREAVAWTYGLSAEQYELAMRT